MEYLNRLIRVLIAVLLIGFIYGCASNKNEIESRNKCYENKIMLSAEIEDMVDQNKNDLTLHVYFKNTSNDSVKIYRNAITHIVNESHYYFPPKAILVNKSNDLNSNYLLPPNEKTQVSFFINDDQRPFLLNENSKYIVAYNLKLEGNDDACYLESDIFQVDIGEQ